MENYCLNYQLKIAETIHINQEFLSICSKKDTTLNTLKKFIEKNGDFCINCLDLKWKSPLFLLFENNPNKEW